MGNDNVPRTNETDEVHAISHRFLEQDSGQISAAVPLGKATKPADNSVVGLSALYIYVEFEIGRTRWTKPHFRVNGEWD